MPGTSRLSGWPAVLSLALLVAVTLALCPPPSAAAGSRPTVAAGALHDPHAIQSAVAAASREFGVPEPVLLAVAYNLSRWEHHRGAPSVAGATAPLISARPSSPTPTSGPTRPGPLTRPTRP